MNINIPEGVDKYTKHILIKKYSDSTKKDLISETLLDTTVIFRDNDIIYPDGKIILNDELVTLFDYEYNKDETGNIISCKITKSMKKNGKSMDIEKIEQTDFYDNLGRLIQSVFKTRDGITYLTKKYEYDCDNNIVSERVKGTDNIITKKYHHGKVYYIESKTIKSKITNTKYQAFFDDKGNVYKVIDRDKHIEKDYERDLNSDGKTLSKTVRFFDISTTNKKLISYITTTYNPVVDYKIDKVIKNGILTEKHTYDLKGDEISLFILEDGNSIFKRKEKSIDPDTGNTINIIKTTITDEKTSSVIKDTTVKTVYDKDNKLLTYAEDNSIVTEYEYNEEGKRKSAITKKLIGEEFVVINKVFYTYETDEESGNTIRTRELTVYDGKGNIISKDIHKEVTSELTDSYEEEKMFFDIAKD